jgi:hypothetical protein
LAISCSNRLLFDQMRLRAGWPASRHRRPEHRSRAPRRGIRCALRRRPNSGILGSHHPVPAHLRGDREANRALHMTDLANLEPIRPSQAVAITCGATFIGRSRRKL